MITLTTLVVWLLVLTVFALTTISTGCCRKRGRMGPRALQSRLVMPILYSVVGLVAFIVTQEPLMKDYGLPFLTVLGAFIIFSTINIPFLLFFWLVLIAIAFWTNVFAAMVILSMGSVAGLATGFILGSRGSDR